MADKTDNLDKTEFKQPGIKSTFPSTNLDLKRKKLGFSMKSRPKTAQEFGGDDSESDSDGEKERRKRVNAMLRKEQERQEKIAQKVVEAAQQEDESVMEYDGVYEQIKKREMGLRMEKDGVVVSDGVVKKESRYIGGLLRAAEKRKMERELVLERKMQGEEGERFVTSGYLERVQQREQLLKDDDAGDVNSFYRNLFEMREKEASADAVVAVSVDQDEAVADGVLLNDSGEIVDKRQLLKGGLNLNPRMVVNPKAVERETPSETKKEDPKKEDLPKPALDQEKISLARQRYLERKNKQK